MAPSSASASSCWCEACREIVHVRSPRADDAVVPSSMRRGASEAGRQPCRLCPSLDPSRQCRSIGLSSMTFAGQLPIDVQNSCSRGVCDPQRPCTMRHKDTYAGLSCVGVGFCHFFLLILVVLTHTAEPPVVTTINLGP